MSITWNPDNEVDEEEEAAEILGNLLTWTNNGVRVARVIEQY